MSVAGQEAKVSYRVQVVRSRLESRPHSGRAELAATGQIRISRASARSRPLTGGLFVESCFVLRRWDSVAVGLHRLHYYKFEQ